jgi:uncharacterized membrane protein YoaK (UPF0700 family)
MNLRFPRRPVQRAVMLCATAGYIDAFGYIALGSVFPANMTGNTVLLGIAAARREWPRVAIFALTLGAFFLGALAASVLKRIFRRPLISFTVAAALLILAQLAPVGPQPTLMLLAAVMGLQGTTLSRFGGINLQTVVVTGTILNLADGIVSRCWLYRGNADTPADVTIPGFAWLAYATGAAAGAVAVELVQRPLLMPAVLLVILVADLAIRRNE